MSPLLKIFIAFFQTSGRLYIMVIVRLSLLIKLVIQPRNTILKRLYTKDIATDEITFGAIFTKLYNLQRGAKIEWI
jgi:hypothetical protein